MTRYALGAVILTISATAPAAAVIGTADVVPAATLLLPYFEVQFSGFSDPPILPGPNTRFSVTNASQHPVIVHLTLWTDWSVATLGFNAYLTGYDLMEVDLRALFAQGTIPGTSHSNLTISPLGDFSKPTSPSTGVGAGVTSCDAQLPLPGLPVFLRDHIRNAHTGQPSSAVGGACSGADHGDGLARGYITVDNVSLCTLDFPTDAGYFINGGNGAASNENVLLGSYQFLDPSKDTGFAGPMVHIEASSDDPRTGPGDYTFYARYSAGADNREPLATSFFAPYINGQTDLIVWRDTKLSQSPTSCLSPPSWVPLSQAQLLIFDQEENPEIPLVPPFPPLPAPPPPFPLATTRVRVGSPDLPTIPSLGWIFSNLDVDTGGLPAFGSTAQGWITVVSPFGLGVSQDGFALDNASAPSGATLPCPTEGSQPCTEGAAPRSVTAPTAAGSPIAGQKGGS